MPTRICRRLDRLAVCGLLSVLPGCSVEPPAASVPQATPPPATRDIVGGVAMFNGKPLVPGVTVGVEGAPAVAVASDGRFKLAAVKNGAHRLWAKVDGGR